MDERDVLNGVGGEVGVKDALSILDTVKVVDDVMLIRYNIEKNHLAIQRKRPSNVRLRNFLVLYLCFVLREVSLITVYFCYHVWCTLAIQRKHPSNVRLRNFLVLYLCFVLREVSLITVYFCYHVCCTLFCQPFPYAYYFL